MKRKGLQDIKTHAGRSTTPGSSARSYIRLSTLEMERIRRQRELDEATARADAAASRVARLTEEIDEIVSSLPKVARRARLAALAEPKGRIADTPEIIITHAYGSPKPARNEMRTPTNDGDPR